MADTPIKHRKLRITWSALCGSVGLLLVVFWVRSYWRMDIAYGQLFHAPTVGIESIRGRVISGFEQAGTSGTQFGTASVLLEKNPYVIRTLEIHETYLGFSLIQQSGGWRLEVPHYFAFGVVCIAAVAPWLRWRFRLRTLLIAITLVAVVLGLVVWLSP
jgi:hypothetical protein